MTETWDFNNSAAQGIEKKCLLLETFQELGWQHSLISGSNYTTSSTTKIRFREKIKQDLSLLSSSSKHSGVVCASLTPPTVKHLSLFLFDLLFTDLYPRQGNCQKTGYFEV